MVAKMARMMYWMMIANASIVACLVVAVIEPLIHASPFETAHIAQEHAAWDFHFLTLTDPLLMVVLFCLFKAAV